SMLGILSEIRGERATKLSLAYLGALITSSVCGTQYLFSAYSTALADRLGFNSVQINTIGSAINYGTYLSGPISGYIVDNYGPRRTCFFSSFFIFTGYFCLAMTYGGVFPSSSFLLCALYLLLAGMASSAAFNSSLVTVARNFVSNRGIAFGFPVALFGLSAFIFAQINNIIFTRDTYDFLIFLAIATGLSMLVGSLFLVAMPIEGELVVSAERTDRISETRSGPSFSNNEGDLEVDRTEDAPLIPKKRSLTYIQEPDIGGWELFNNRDALFLCITLFLLGGTGLMYINNVGAIIKSLYLNSSENSNPNVLNGFSEEMTQEIQRLQNLHVSLLSISSCFGRISAGIFSDITRNLYNIRRIIYIILSGIYLFIGHFLAGFMVKSLGMLYPVTILVGLGFGTIFSIAPTITSEWFGSRRFGLNWGIMSMFPAFGGQLFNFIFGFNSDLHQGKCSGDECYNKAFYF
ncbi:12664_t:CDS:2, partial [Acaulospora morrowiae]